MDTDREEKKEEERQSGANDLEALRKERDEYLAGWQRAKADLINYKRETAESLAQFTDFAELGFVRKFLPVLDALESGAQAGSADAQTILKLMLEILKNEGVQEINPEEGAAFNPEFHEAIEGAGAHILEVLQKGYQYKKYVIRPAKVRVKE
jgi:molecular chaperone GrpE